MMLRATFALVLIALLGPVSAAAGDNAFQVLAYHDVRDRVAEDIDADQYAISTARLIEHFTWLRINGFTVVSIDDILAARRGEAQLPDRAVLLSFDDGFRSVATHVLPLLELFDYPAVVSIVTDWIENDPGVIQAGRQLTRNDFMSWDQVRMLAGHELVEIASHSHAMHQGIVGNPAGNEQPAAVTALYRDGEYESLPAYRERVTGDLARSVQLIERHTGQRPRVMTWPFGAYNEITLEIAAELGMETTLTLTDGSNALDRLGIVTRHLIEANAGVDDLGWSLLYEPEAPVVRAAQVDLDYVYDPDPVQQEANLGQLLDRIQAMGITHVFLQAFADPDADGGAQALYFPNRYLPMRADLFNRAAWQLSTRADVRVFAWLPVLSFEGEGIDADWRVLQRIDGELASDLDSEPRLSPFSAEARELIRGIYADLARHASIDGILFHDDGRFNEFEDWSPAAVAAYRDEFGLDFSPELLAGDPELRSAWARFRADALTDFSLALAAEVRRYRPEIRTVRNLFATALLEPLPELRLAQHFDSFAAAYDYVAIMAMPRFENYTRHDRFYKRLARLALNDAAAVRKVIFELQTVDWRTGKAIDSAEIRDTLHYLQSLGVRNLAYYPDDFVSGHPSLPALRDGMSVARFPWRATP